MIDTTRLFKCMCRLQPAVSTLAWHSHIMYCMDHCLVTDQVVSTLVELLYYTLPGQVSFDYYSSISV